MECDPFFAYTFDECYQCDKRNHCDWGNAFVSGSNPWIAGVAIFVATINIAGGFLVTQRMLKMFRKE